jgi:hypothetical protein
VNYWLNTALTLTLSRRERGPTELFERATPTCNTESNSSLEEHQNRFPSPESNSNLEKHRNRLPFPLTPAPLGERAGVRGKKDLQDITKPKPDLQ